jgi:hypothetical protein
MTASSDLVAASPPPQPRLFGKFCARALLTTTYEAELSELSRKMVSTADFAIQGLAIDD